MAVGARSYKPLRGVLGNEIVLIGGYFEWAATGAPTALAGEGWTVAYTSAGIWTVTLDQQYKAFVGSGCTLHYAAADNVDLTLNMSTVDVLTGKTIKFRTMTGSTATTGATGAGNGISFMLMLRTSSLSSRP